MKRISILVVLASCAAFGGVVVDNDGETVRVRRFAGCASGCWAVEYNC